MAKNAIVNSPLMQIKSSVMMTPAVHKNNQTNNICKNPQGFSNNKPVSVTMTETPIDHGPSYKLASQKIFKSSKNAKQATED